MLDISITGQTAADLLLISIWKKEAMSALDTLKQELAETQSAVLEVQAAVDALKQKFADQAQALADVQTQLADAIAKLADVVTLDEVAAAKADLDAVQTQLGVIKDEAEAIGTVPEPPAGGPPGA